MNAMNPSKRLPARKERFTELPFFFYLSLALIFVAGWSIYDSPALREPSRLIPFAVLMVVHIALYWLVIEVVKKERLVPYYLIGQSILALVINLLGNNIGLPIGLYMALIGLTVGIYNLSRMAIGLIAFHLVMALYCASRIPDLGGMLWSLAWFIPSLVFVVIYVFLYNRQTEARDQAQRLAADLEQANRRLAEYSEQVETLTLANERQRMARELHDTLSQGLAGVILQLEAADAHLLAERTERARSILRQTMAQARETLTEARQAIDDLRRTALDLEESIRQETLRFTEATGIPCPLELTLDGPVPEAVREPAHRAVAETLSNIARHAQATRAQVTVKGSLESGLEITVWDNGCGFQPQTAIGQPGHYGLLGIRERARLANGSLEVQSEPEKGTRIILHLPYPTAAGEYNTAEKSRL